MKGDLPCSACFRYFRMGGRAQGCLSYELPQVAFWLRMASPPMPLMDFGPLDCFRLRRRFLAGFCS